MSKLRRARRGAGTVLFVLIALGWFLYLRPPILAGSTSYVFIRGTSMEPTYHTGDLVLVRTKPRYAAGDIAAFAVDGPTSGRAVVIHRIKEVRADGTHVFQGDNRDEADPWHPTADEIVGTPLVLVPAAGRWLAELASRPLTLGLLAGFAAMLVVLVGAPTTHREPTRSSAPVVPQRERRQRPLYAAPLTEPASSDGCEEDALATDLCHA